MTRDPRVDPKPGDELEIEAGCKWYRRVTATALGHVVFFSRCGNQWLDSASRVPLEDWQKTMKSAEVLHAAE